MLNETVLNRLSASRIDVHLMRIAIVFIFLMFGTAKFALYEAEGVARTAEHYWLFAWMYPIWGVQGASNAIGTIELTTGGLIALGAVSPRAGLIGGLMGMATFLVTLSFSFGADLWQEGFGFPFMGSSAQFLFKDAGLFALCLALTLDAVRRLAPRQVDRG
ncbi:YkgB family protein [Sphingobium chungangianum]